MMDVRIIPMAVAHVEKAFALFLEAYDRERKANPALPAEPGRSGDLKSLMGKFAARREYPGYVALGGDDRSTGRIIGFMLPGYAFDFKGQKAIIVPEFCHAAPGGDRNRTYQMLYRACAGHWMDGGGQLHLIGHFAHDRELRDILFRLGYGAIIEERVRELAPVKGAGGSAAPLIERAVSPEELIPLEREHRLFYPQAPTFITKPVDESSLRSGLEEYLGPEGALFFANGPKGEPSAYMAVGESASEGEGFLLRNTNTAQLKSAFIKETLRGKGVGTALLNRAVEWARQEGYDRMFVEHETANMYGSNFWGKYFDAYLCFAMRYVEDCLDPAGKV